MKLKYYLRGLGIGILVTTIILTIANHVGNKISDAEVIKRAEALGMVMSEDETLFPPEQTDEQATTGKPEEPTTKETTMEEPATEEPTTEEPTTEEPTTEEPTTEEPTTEEPTTEEPATKPSGGDVVAATLVIKSGMYSEKVSQELQRMGIISDWVDFNQYLSDNKYDVVIKTGTYTVNSSMTYEELAKLITGK